MRDRILGIVQRYLGAYHASGDENVSTVCPFHAVKDGTPFSVNVVRGLYHCFTCGESGTIIQLVYHLGRRYGLSPKEIHSETDGLQAILLQTRKDFEHYHQRAWTIDDDPFQAETVLSEVVLAHWRTQCPINLLKAGFTEEVLQRCEVGFDERLGRVVYPIRDLYGNLAGVSGGTVFAGTNPKYRVYQGPRRGLNGAIIPSDFGLWFDEQYPEYEFSRARYLWNYHQVYPRLFFGKEVRPYIIVVEGFKAALWLIQHGYVNTVALMGSKISPSQKLLLSKPDCAFLLFLDNDQAGRSGTRQVGFELDRLGPVRVARYPEGTDGCQPDDLQPEWLRWAVASAELLDEYTLKENRHGSRRIPSWC